MSLQVWKSRFGGYARAAARQGAFAVEFRELNGVFGAFAVLNAFGVPPGGARRALHSEAGGDAKQPPKRRKSARNHAGGARDVMLISRVESAILSDKRSSQMKA